MEHLIFFGLCVCGVYWVLSIIEDWIKSKQPPCSVTVAGVTVQGPNVQAVTKLLDEIARRQK